MAPEFPYRLGAARLHRGATPLRGRAPAAETGCLGSLESQTIAPANLQPIVPAETTGRWSNKGGRNAGQKLADRGPVRRVLQLQPRLSVRNDGRPDLRVLHRPGRIQDRSGLVRGRAAR